MRVLYLGGWLLVVLGCFGALAEIVARMVPNGGGAYLSAYDVWYALWPGNLVVTKIRLESLFGPWAWNPVMTSLLTLPAWAVFGLPGGVLVWLGWPRRGRNGDDRREEEEALFLYDSLADQVEAEEREFAAFRNRLDADSPADDAPEPTPTSPQGDDSAPDAARKEDGAV